MENTAQLTFEDPQPVIENHALTLRRWMTALRYELDEPLRMPAHPTPRIFATVAVPDADGQVHRLKTSFSLEIRTSFDHRWELHHSSHRVAQRYLRKLGQRFVLSLDVSVDQRSGEATISALNVTRYDYRDQR